MTVTHIDPTGRFLTVIRDPIAPINFTYVDQSTSSLPTAPPASWSCDPKKYAAKDGCDCNCGAFDPDCLGTSFSSPTCAQNEVKFVEV